MLVAESAIVLLTSRRDFTSAVTAGAQAGDHDRASPTPMPAVGAVVDYVPAALGYVDGIDLPLTTWTSPTASARPDRRHHAHPHRPPRTLPL
ncbi:MULTISPECIES: hypothetical protein [unclassified Streptomyces]|uniref:hypothetical protein n=1 Tax=unclassified Streptomyces TaxID=2593676 RepID=UPI002DD9C1AA|nr:MULTISPECIES: hypothetical protein [unclassified Streptomyces]WSC58173.1 hypothetical protein OG808_41520 [Streptomyces sp. NBC_01761]WSD22502.1 hypothetical protein OHA26_02730 [Streptomyces sp. NBC_01751]